MIPLLAIILPLLLLGGIVSTVSGGGLGIVLVLVFRHFFDIRTSVVLMSLLGFAIQGAKLWWFRGAVRWDIAKWYMLTGIPASFAGGFLLFLLPERFIEIAIAVMCVLFVGAELRRGRDVVLLPKVRNLLAAGVVNGVVGGTIGHGALLRLPALLAFGLTKEQLVGTSSVIAIAMNAGKVTAYSPNFEWSRGVVVLLAASTPVILLSVWIGKRLLRHVSPALFERLLLCVILLGAIRIILFP